MKRISLFVGEPQLKQFQELAQRRDRPASELIREALDRYLLDQEQQVLTRPVRKVTKGRTK